MKRNQSIQENSIAGYYFAVQPLTLCFLRDYDSSFNLYFEKGLQIISKNQTRHPNPRKNEVVSFCAPPTVPHFRIQSDKSLEYEWSLYASQEEGDEHEQFVEGQKVTLKAAWQQYQDNKINVWEGQLEFNSIRCKLTYLVAIAKNAAELQTVLQTHLQLLNQVIPPLLKQEERGSLKSIEVVEEVADEGTVKTTNNLESPKRQSIKELAQPPAGEMKYSKILNEYLSPEGDMPEDPKRASATREREHALSFSELQIAEAVGKEVEDYEASKIVEEKVEFIPEVTEVIEEYHVQPLETLGANDSQEIIMTQSQLLNEQRQVIVPPAFELSRNKLILLALALAVLLSTIAYFGLKMDPRPAKKPTKQKKAEAVKIEKDTKPEKAATKVSKPSKAGKGRGKGEKER